MLQPDVSDLMAKENRFKSIILRTATVPMPSGSLKSATWRRWLTKMAEPRFALEFDPALRLQSLLVIAQASQKIKHEEQFWAMMRRVYNEGIYKHDLVGAWHKVSLDEEISSSSMVEFITGLYGLIPSAEALDVWQTVVWSPYYLNGLVRADSFDAQKWTTFLRPEWSNSSPWPAGWMAKFIELSAKELAESSVWGATHEILCSSSLASVVLTTHLVTSDIAVVKPLSKISTQQPVVDLSLLTLSVYQRKWKAALFCLVHGNTFAADIDTSKPLLKALTRVFKEAQEKPLTRGSDVINFEKLHAQWIQFLLKYSGELLVADNLVGTVPVSDVKKPESGRL